MYLRSPLTGDGDLTWRQQYNGSWGDEKTILDSSNYSNFVQQTLSLESNMREWYVHGSNTGLNQENIPYNNWAGNDFINYIILKSKDKKILFQFGINCEVSDGVGSSSFNHRKILFSTSFSAVPSVFCTPICRTYELGGRPIGVGAVTTQYFETFMYHNNRAYVIDDTDETTYAYFWMAVGLCN